MDDLHAFSLPAVHGFQFFVVFLRARAWFRNHYNADCCTFLIIFLFNEYNECMSIIQHRFIAAQDKKQLDKITYK